MNNLCGQVAARVLRAVVVRLKVVVVVMVAEVVLSLEREKTAEVTICGASWSILLQEATLFGALVLIQNGKCEWRIWRIGLLKQKEGNV